MVLIPINIRNMAAIQIIMPMPSIGLNIGCPSFLKELCITTGPKKNIGNAQPNLESPFTSIFLSVAIAFNSFSYIFMLFQ